jgi:single-strand DNA-binding protein
MEKYLPFEGVVKIVFDTQEFKNNFKKREIVVSTEDQYPQHIKFEFTDDNGINKLDEIVEGDKVKILFELRGSEWQEKFFTNLRGVAITTFDEEKKFEANQSKVVKVPTKPTYVEPSEDDEDNLPF